MVRHTTTPWDGCVQKTNGRDDHGVSQVVRNSPLAAHLDTPMPKFVMHLRVRSTKRHDRSFCGESTQALTDAGDVVECAACKAEVTRRREKSELGVLKALAKGPVSIRGLHRETRQRLEGAGLAKAYGASLFLTDAGRARLREVG